MKHLLSLFFITASATLVGNLAGYVVPDRKLTDEKDPPKEVANGMGMKFVWIPRGHFTMGSPKDEVRRGDDEIQHKVTLTKGFYMGACTVTQEQWRTVMGETPSYFNGENNLPVESVSWD